MVGFSLRSTWDAHSELAYSARSLRDCRPTAVTLQATQDALPRLAALQPAFGLLPACAYRAR